MLDARLTTAAVFGFAAKIRARTGAKSHRLAINKAIGPLYPPARAPNISRAIPMCVGNGELSRRETARERVPIALCNTIHGSWGRGAGGGGGGSNYTSDDVQLRAVWKVPTSAPRPWPNK